MGFCFLFLSVSAIRHSTVCFHRISLYVSQLKTHPHLRYAASASAFRKCPVMKEKEAYIRNFRR